MGSAALLETVLFDVDCVVCLPSDAFLCFITGFGQDCCGEEEKS